MKTGNELFRQSEKSVNQVELLLNGDYSPAPGMWPLVDEALRLTPFIAVGNKNGIPESFAAIREELGNSYKFIYNCQSGPYLISEYDRIFDEFDGVFDLDYREKHDSKSLYCNHSMMVRSMPYEGFFWEPIEGDCRYDFNMLTWAIPGDMAKRWDRGKEICKYLCGKGLRGIVVTQRGTKSDVIKGGLEKFVESGLLDVRDGNASAKDFHHLMASARYSIFPNTVDAFPKFIIENLLADVPVIVSDDLLLGREVLAGLGEGACTKVSFSKSTSMEEVYRLVSLEYNGSSPRGLWLEKYSFEKLSVEWANEINRFFGTSYKKLFFMNHITRLRDNGLI